MSPDFRRQIASEEQGVLRSVSLDHHKVLTSYRKPPPLGWTVVVSVPEQTPFAPLWAKAAYLAAGCWRRAGPVHREGGQHAGG